jgi:hypothetical protein
MQNGISPTRPPAFGFRSVRLVLGLVLLLAAGLKAHALWSAPFQPIALFISPRWQVAAIELETVLGLWLLSGVRSLAAWRAAMLSFSLLAGVSAYLGIVGVPSCGCFGQVHVHPWLALAVDLVAMGSLWQTRPNSWRVSLRPKFPPLRRTATVGVGASALLAVSALPLFTEGQLLSSTLALLRSESLVIEPAVIDLGSGPRGVSRTFSIRVRNRSDHPIRLLGGTAGCKGVATKSMPLSIQARETENVIIVVRFTGPVGHGQQPYRLYTDDPSQPVLVGRCAGLLVQPSRQSRSSAPRFANKALTAIVSNRQFDICR